MENITYKQVLFSEIKDTCHLVNPATLPRKFQAATYYASSTIDPNVKVWVIDHEGNKEKKMKKSFHAEIKKDRDGTWLSISRDADRMAKALTNLSRDEMEIVIEVLQKELKELENND